jgi:splicing factor U2AF subunit
VALNGRFAFVEFRVPEYATAALQLNGQIALMGNTLKIARPASYVEPAVGATVSDSLH